MLKSLVLEALHHGLKQSKDTTQGRIAKKLQSVIRDSHSVIRRSSETIKLDEHWKRDLLLSGFRSFSPFLKSRIAEDQKARHK